ncbi:PREDICTED: integrin-alpha FG-GAP repeat-containing protein 2-like [Wasmannia auropunctata]|uniref:integrin-alpha FG-GAP repeat-containing protein 2-like n=1 Tax=Wasmannia auropunctata TaxID=64793 RepID=UPI0005EF5AB3|nr:PREDICTED: integrin-alpha FG-GAP repeat-containing protein 2-like [Wasmannia auropunctata]XP_011693175.1 PREDICTED: integrin-alpha FG-GAP repeat-containing protein 2-like [Wasmannia auropunctata]
MRAVSFVKRLQWELPGTVCRHGLTIGDVDNDGDNELVVGTAEGELYIFKGSELWQKIIGLGLITSVAIGDIFNYGRNALVVICGDGWTHIFYSPRSVNPNNSNVFAGQHNSKDTSEQDNFKTTTDIGNSQNTEHIDNTNEINELSGKMECVHVQRIPTNTKTVLIADVDKDGANEMILGLTDRVVRSYRWSSNADLETGKLVGLNKWECTNQIGTVTLQHTGDGTPTLLVAQPGGTFMRIKCNAEDCQSKNSSCEAVDYQTLGISRMRNQNISTEIIGDLEPGVTPFISTIEPKMSSYMPTNKLPKQSFADDSQLNMKTFKPASLEFKRNYSQPAFRKNSLDMAGEYSRKDFTSESQGPVRFYSPVESSGADEMDGNFIGGNVILGEYDDNKTTKDTLLPSFTHFSQNNNNSKNISNSNDNSNNISKSNQHEEIIREDKTESSNEVISENAPKGKPYALATLDGTIMLVQDEIILWAMQVDHQIFALCRLDVTGDNSDEIIACAWDGQTYILDQQRHSVRFQFEEPVRAFCTGNYNVIPGTSSPSLVYNTFNNKIVLYYDVTLPSMTITPLNPMKDFEPDETQVLEKLLGECNVNEKQQKMQQLTEWLLYGVH